MSKVKLGWSALTIPQKLIKATSVNQTMAANADVYLTPNPKLEELDAATAALVSAESEAIKGGVDRTVVRNARLTELTDLMNRLVAYVQLTSNGDAENIAKAGMEVQKAPEPWPVPDRVTGLEATPGGNAGTINLKWDAVRYRKSYVVEMFVAGNIAPPDDSINADAKDASGAWEPILLLGKRSYTVIGLVQGKLYKFRVGAANNTGTGVYSEEAQSVAG
jgi:hypothetical protein